MFYSSLGLRFRMIGIVLVLLVSSSVGSQETRPEDPLEQFSPQMIVRIREHEIGADMVEVSMVDPDYPADLLVSQVESLGQMLDNSLRGFETYKMEMEPGNPDSSVLKATFAVDGLVDNATGKVNLTPLARAFAGAPEPYTVDGMFVMLNEFQTSSSTLKSFSSRSARVEGRIGEGGTGVEYDLALLTQDPARITIDPSAQEVEEPVEVPVDQETPTWIWLLVGLGGIFAGALVYFLVSKRTAKPVG